MRHCRILGWSAIGLAVLATPAAAQQARQFEVRASMGVTYDDNVARSNAVTAALRGIEQEDFIYNPSVAVDIVQPFGRQAAFLRGSVGYDFYDKNDQLNRERIDLSGGVSSPLGPCRPTLGGSYKRQQSEL